MTNETCPTCKGRREVQSELEMIPCPTCRERRQPPQDERLADAIEWGAEIPGPVSIYSRRDSSTFRLPTDHPYYAGIADAAAQSQSVPPELVEALRAGGRVIDYAASILWNGRSAAIANRPAKVDADLRAFRTALDALPKPVDPLDEAIGHAFDRLPPEWTREIFIESVGKSLRDKRVRAESSQ
ncbi:hypothetical protein [Croceicoccus sp. YJ47]|uniref:hypothetical protein n=1 Tax=Croceicoccus sp. YJ47 TaxID=2798724 RepID=UPI0019242F45|nr:hypothetical protein [Croceicoccus sp. YJ47]QQN73920.1 hypothetical protein JD971_14415 [Croceicoccus sp. YJ47]